MTQSSQSNPAEYTEGIAPTAAPKKEEAKAPVVEAPKKEEAKAGEHVIVNSVKHRGTVYKKGETHTLDSSTADLFRAGGFIAQL